MAFIELHRINKSFIVGNNTNHVLTDLDLTIDKGELVAIMGKSGCGKTSLLNILAGIDISDSGEYYLDGSLVKISSTSDGVKFRRNNIGIVLQHFALINDYTVYENVELGLWESSLSTAEMKKRTNEMLSSLGLFDMRNKYPSTLSGGEKQRVAIGRALVAKPSLLLADEPTGALDLETEHDIVNLFKRLNKETGTTTIIVTHDKEVAEQCNRTIVLKKQ